MKSRSDIRLLSFPILACVMSWPYWMASGVLSRASAPVYDFRWLLAQIGVFGPSFAALIISSTVSRDLRRNSLRILPAVLLPLIGPGVVVAASGSTKVMEFPLLPSVATAIAAAVVLLFFSPLNHRLLLPGTGRTHARPGIRYVALALTFFPALFLVSWVPANHEGGELVCAASQHGMGAFVWFVLVAFSHNLLFGGSLGEEIGWRGFLLPRLLERNGPLAASLSLGVIWALWHLPADLSAGFLVEGPAAILVRIVWTLPAAILYTWFYLKSQGNLLVPLFLHTSINTLADLGLSNYERSMILFFILMVLAALTVTAVSPAFRTKVATKHADTKRSGATVTDSDAV